MTEKSCKVINIVTPGKYILNGLWFGGNSPKRAIIFIHGLTSNVFANHDLVIPLADKNTAVITFNNRGHDMIAKIHKVDKRKKKGYTSEYIGETHEVFTDCVDDIQGVVNFVRKSGVKEIYLVGQSTGSHKSVYYITRRGKRKFIKGVVLLSPMSDYASALKFDKKGQLKKATDVARKMVEEGREHNLIPLDIWEQMDDAQRFLSLYTPESEEEIFTYAQPVKIPSTLRKIKIPILVILAEKDEYRDRSMKQIAEWFKKNVKARNKKIVILENAAHNFKGNEKDVLYEIGAWLRTITLM